jgi:hypothetical protein
MYIFQGYLNAQNELKHKTFAFLQRQQVETHIFDYGDANTK